MSYGARLGEERRRLGFRQAEFSEMVGTDVPKQSLYENDRRQLKADYLARLHSAGVDVHYVLTGKRSEGAFLEDESTALLATWLAMPVEVRESVQRLIEDLVGYAGEGERAED